MGFPIPMLLFIEFLKHCDDDRMEHHLRFGVVGMPSPITADVESDFYKNPRVKDLWRDGGVRLPARLQDLLIIASFDRLWPLLDGNDISELVLPDATHWIDNIFSADDASIVLAELRRHVVPDLVADPAHCTSLIPVNLPAKGDDQ